MTVNVLGETQVNIAKIKGVELIDLTVKNSQDNNNKDLFLMTLELQVEFDKQAVLQHDVAHIEVFLNKRIDNDKLNEFTNMLSRREKDFSSKSAYINFLNNVKQSYDQIKSVLEIERYNLFNWQYLTSLSPKSLISDGEIADFAIDATQQSLIIANTFSPPPIAIKRFIPKNKLEIKLIETKAANTTGVAVRERVNDNKVRRKRDLSEVASNLHHKRIPLSELFRENKHEQLEDIMLGTIDTQHPSANPENPIIEQQQDDVEEGSESQFIFSIEPENLVTGRIKLQIADQQVTGDNFQIKCIVCSHSIFAPYQILFENVDYNYIRAARKDLARPSVKIEKIINQPSKMKLDIHIDEQSQENRDNRNSIKWIAGYIIKRRKIVEPNETQESFTTIETIRLNPELINDIRKQTFYTDESLQLDCKNYEYRVVPINRFSEEGSRFADVVTPDRCVVAAVKRFGSRKIIGQNVIVATQIDEKTVSIVVSNVDFSIVTVELMKKNITLRDKKFSVVDVMTSTKGVLEDVNFTDKDIVRKNVYEYTAQLYDLQGNVSVTSNTAIILIKSQKASTNVITKIDSVKKENNVVKFNLKTAFKQTDRKSKLSTLITDGIEAQKLDKVFSDELKSNLLRKNVGNIPIYKITRVNMKTGESDGTILTTKATFDESEITTQKDRNASYSYKVETNVVNIDNLKEAADDPTKLKIAETSDEQDDGTIKLSTQKDTIDSKIEESSSPQSANIQVAKEQEQVAVVKDFSASLINRNNVLLKWKRSNSGVVDFYQLERSCGVRARESLGTTEQAEFLDRLRGTILLCREITYYITPIDNNQFGETKSITLSRDRG